MWTEYLGTLEDPWDNTNLLHAAQKLWDNVFKQNPQFLQVKKEPIFAVVRLLLYFFVSTQADTLVGHATLL